MCSVVNSESGQVSELPNTSWWNRRSRRERILCGIAGICLVMVTAMAIASAIIGYHYQSVQPGFNSTGICFKPGCVKAAAAILDNINEEVDPCNNFYEFACGGWMQKQLIPDDRSEVDVFSLIKDDLDKQLRSIVENGIKDTDPQYSQNIKSMYNSCMNTTHIEMLGNSPLVEVLNKVGGWPVADGPKWSADKFDWMDALIALREIGFAHDVLLTGSTDPGPTNNIRYFIELDQAKLGMPDRNYLLKGMEDPIVAAYYQLMVDSAVLMGANKIRATKEMKEALKFEITLANISIPSEELRNKSILNNKMTVDDLYKLAPGINWDKYFNYYRMDEFSRSEEVIVRVPVYVQNVGKLLAATDKRIIANYLMWRVVVQALPYLHRSWGEIFQHYNTILTGKVQQEARWEKCLETLSGRLGTVLDVLYVKKHFSDDSKALAEEMVEYIRREFLNILLNVDWMDPRTKERALEKVERMEAMIGYHEGILIKWILPVIFEGLHLNSTSFFENIIVLKKWTLDEVLSKLRKHEVEEEWNQRFTAAVANAFYYNSKNSLTLPAGVLQGAFFDKDRPSYLNFGAVGFAMGHEMTHGFDDIGRQFDEAGNNVNWWEPETDSAFKERAQCIIDQYGNFSVKEVKLNVNGINTQGENIADNGGIKEAYRAYLQWIQDYGEEDFLPGIKYSPKQLFWISVGNTLCAKYRPEALKLKIMTDTHTPGPYRLIGSLSNLPEFAEEFGCPVGSPMNPVKKCSVW